MTDSFNLLGPDSVDAILPTLIYALPVFVLVTLIVLLSRRNRAVKVERAEHSPTDAVALRAVAQNSVTSADATAATTVIPAVVENAAANTVLYDINVAVPQSVVSGSKVDPKPPADDETTSYADATAALQAQIDQVMKVQPNNTLAPLFLEMARHHKAAGDEASYLAALRSAAGLGAQHGPRAAHAEARLQLAEAAHRAGDLTGACEQWQMARDALYDDGQKEVHARVEQLMRDNGCPTDWVLNDF